MSTFVNAQDLYQLSKVFDFSLIVCESTNQSFSWHRVMAPSGHDAPIVLMFNIEQVHYQELVWDGVSAFRNAGQLPKFLRDRFDRVGVFPRVE